MITYLHNIRKVSLLFFVVIGAIHVASGALFFNGEAVSITNKLYQTSFIPFLICSLVYAFSSIKINIYNYSGKDSKLISIAMSAIGLVIISAIAILSFTFPNL